jgi:hypothetical protein
MKAQYKQKHDKLKSKLKNGESITKEEEEWMDGEGNLVDGKLLISKISSLPTSLSDSTALKSTEVKTLVQILDFCCKNLAVMEEKKDAKKNNMKNSKEKQPEKNNKKIETKSLANKTTNKSLSSQSKEVANSSKKRKKNSESTSSSKISNASYAQKVEVLDWHYKNGKNQSKTALHFSAIYPHLKIKQPLISKWLKEEDSIRSKVHQTSNPESKRIRTISHPQVEAALVEWLKQATHLNLTVTGEIIKEKWRDFARLAGIGGLAQLKFGMVGLFQEPPSNKILPKTRRSCFCRY